MKKIFLFAIASLLGLGTAHAELVMVANPTVKFSSLSQNDLSRLFLGQTGRFPDGSVAIALNASGDGKGSFYRQVLQKSPEQMEKYWARMIFTGRAQPPREVSPREVKSVVATTPGAIGYIDSNQVDASVKVIQVN